MPAGPTHPTRDQGRSERLSQLVDHLAGRVRRADRSSGHARAAGRTRHRNRPRALHLGLVRTRRPDPRATRHRPSRPVIRSPPNPRNSARSQYVHSASKASDTVYTPTLSEQCKIRNLDERSRLRTGRCRTTRTAPTPRSRRRSSADGYYSDRMTLSPGISRVGRPGAASGALGATAAWRRRGRRRADA
jgi:hypothetical protein